VKTTSDIVDPCSSVKLADETIDRTPELPPTRFLRLPALQVRQTAESILYSFAVDAKSISSFAAVSRLRRDANLDLSGYQRTEIRSHILEIKKYLESPDPLIPNAIVIAFDQRCISRHCRPESRRALPVGYHCHPLPR